MTVETAQSKKILFNQVDRMISADYPQMVDQSLDQYASQMHELVNKTLMPENSQEMITLVDPRVPFKLQLRALGLDENPATLYTPTHSTHRPYVAKVSLINLFDGNLGKSTYEETKQSLPKNLRAATPFESLLISDQILEQSMAAFGGGRYDHIPGITGDFQHLFQYYCLERFLGKPRMSFIEANSFDGFVAFAVAKRGHSI